MHMRFLTSATNRLFFLTQLFVPPGLEGYVQGVQRGGKSCAPSCGWEGREEGEGTRGDGGEVTHEYIS